MFCDCEHRFYDVDTQVCELREVRLVEKVDPTFHHKRLEAHRGNIGTWANPNLGAPLELPLYIAKEDTSISTHNSPHLHAAIYSSTILHCYTTFEAGPRPTSPPAQPHPARP